MLSVYLLGVGLAACPPAVQIEQPDCGVQLVATARIQVNTQRMAAIISAFRRENGLGPVRVDAQLNAFALRHSRAMATYNAMGHDVGASWSERRRAVRARVMAENVGAAYNNVDEAFESWRNSPSHRANMLDPVVTRIGIAAVPAPGSQFYRNFWTLVLASR